MDAGRFREDLYYRLNVVELRIPPLRERREDILWLARAFLARYAASEPVMPRRLSVTAEAALLRHDWPGNVRELKHCIERACILTARSVLEGGDLFEDRLGPTENAADGLPMALADYLQRCERHYIIEALDKRGWQISETALALGISRKSLWERMRRLRITSGDDEPV